MSYPYSVICRYEDATTRSYLAEAHGTLSAALDALLTYQQGRWESVSLTAVVRPLDAKTRQVLAAGHRLAKPQS